MNKVMKKQVVFLVFTVLALLFGNRVCGENALKFEKEGLHFSSDWDVDPQIGEIMIDNPDIWSSDGGTSYQFPLENGCLVLPSVVEHEGVTYTVVKVRGIVNQQELLSLTIPVTVRSVSDLYGCPKLEVADLGSVRVLGNITDLPALKEMILPSDVSIGIRMSDLTNIGLKDYVAPQFVLDRFSFCDWPELETLDLSAMNGIGVGVLSRFPKLTTLIMPATVGESNSGCVGFESLDGLSELKSLTMPEYVPDGYFISDCFTDCGKLEAIYSPASVPMDVKVLTNKEELIWPCAFSSVSASGASEGGVSDREEEDGPEPIYEHTNIGTDKVDTDNCVVYVPRGSVEAYKAHPSWSVFKNIVEYDFASKETIRHDGEEVMVSVSDGEIRVIHDCAFEVYDIAGKRSPSRGLSAGIYIVKTSEGTVVKVRVP